jgi:hypothetical protein
LPGTTTPVQINTVNGGDPFGTGAANPQFFNNNDLTDGGPFFDIEYDGFTDVFTASATGLSTTDEIMLSLIIEDVGDSSFDSAVFLQGGSLGGVTPPPSNVIPLPASAWLLISGFASLAGLRRLRRAA